MLTTYVRVTISLIVRGVIASWAGGPSNMFHPDAANIVSRVLTTSLPKGSEDVISGFIANPNDGAMNLLETIFNLPPRIVVELKHLRDNYRPSVSSELRAKYETAFNAVVGSPHFMPDTVREYLQVCLEVLSADRRGVVCTGLDPVIGQGFKAARLSAGLTQKQVASEFSLGIGSVARLESGTAGDMIFERGQAYLGFILGPGGNVEWKAVSFLLGQTARHPDVYEYMRQSYGKKLESRASDRGS